MKQLLTILLLSFTSVIYSQNDVNNLNKYGSKHGLWKETSSDSTLRVEAYYNNGVKDGFYKTYRINGTLYGSGFMKNGELHGKYTIFDENGNKLCVLIWDMGILIDQKFFNKDAKETGVIEEIGGEKYVWLFGELVPTKILNDG